MTSAINSVRRYMFLCYVYVLLGILYSSSRRVSIGLTLIPADASYSRKGLKPWHFVEFRFWHEADPKSPFKVILVKTMPIADEQATFTR